MKSFFTMFHWHFSWWFNYFFLSLLLRSAEAKGASYGIELEKWGSPYGGWYIPYSLLKKNWIYYLVGVGRDATFDARLTERIGCHVYSFDPTPESMEYMKQHKANKKIHYLPIGIWNKNKTMRFGKPLHSGWVSHSILDIQVDKNQGFSAKCKRLTTVMKELDHSRIDLLKLDISGAEYAVLEDMFKEKILPKVLLIEFDQPVALFKTYQMINKLLKKGYLLATKDMWDFTFVHQSAV